MKGALVIFFSCATAASAATIVVNSSADNTTVDGQCTLREAIIAANTNATTGDCTAGTAGPDTINFAIGSGPQTINPLSALPALTEPATIDGTTQPGFSGTPIIELNGGSAGLSAAGLTLIANGNTIRGLVIHSFSFLGINILSANNTIQGNYIGVDMAGTNGLPNVSGGIGITGAAATNNTIGGTAAGAGNVISANSSDGVTIISQSVGLNVVQGNTIGLNAPRTSVLPNKGQGVDLISTSANTVGGTAAGAGNIIAGNLGSGVHIQAAANNLVQGNQIGLFLSGTPTGNGSAGVRILNSNNNTIGASTTGAAGGNVILGNGGAMFVGTGAGVAVFSGTGNRISTNSMSFNVGTLQAAAIDLGGDLRTANDACDPDTGPNNLLNYPVLTAAAVSGGTTTVAGTLNSAASSTFTIEFFSSPPAAFDQGVTFLGSTTVTTTAGCTAAFAVQLPVAVATTPVPFSVTATATDAANDTSEMSLPVFAAPALTAVKSFSPALIVAGDTSLLSLTITNPGPGTVTSLAVTDVYPSGLVNDGGTPTTSCGGTITATPGTGSFSLSGGSLGPGLSCQATVVVTSAAPVTYTNTIPAGGITGTYTPPSTTITAPTMNAAPVSGALVVARDIPAITPLGLLALLMAVGAIALMRLRG